MSDDHDDETDQHFLYDDLLSDVVAATAWATESQDGRSRSLASIARVLANELTSPVAQQKHQISKELRATLEDLEALKPVDGDEADRISDLSSAV